MPSPTPPAGRPLRLAFVGAGTDFAACLPGTERRDVQPAVLELPAGGDAGALRRDLAALRPHVVVVFGPEALPPGALAGVPAATLGVLTGGGASLEHVDAAGFDRLLALDPSLGEAAPVWRSAPLPVSDRLFAPVAPITGRPRVVAVGASTPHRELMLSNAKQQHPDLRHVPAGAGALDGADVAVNVHDAAGERTFEHHVLLHLAAGHLVLSEPLAPQHGLERGIDFLEIATPGGLAWTIEQLHRFPRAWHRVRVRGRLKADQFRASRVWPRLAGDLLADVAAFGSDRDEQAA